MDGGNGASSLKLISNALVLEIRSRTAYCASFLALTVVTAFYAVAGTKLDLVYNAALLAYFNWDSLAQYIHTAIEYLPSPFIYIFVIVVPLLTFALRSSRESTCQGPGQPYLISCKTTHRRLFPKKHSFSYSYLTVGIPVDFRGSVNGMIGVDEDPVFPYRRLIPFASVLFRSWYSIQASDHLERRHSELGLRKKLNNFLLSEVIILSVSKSICAKEYEGHDPTDYPHAYLITAARFAGYNFNPVSLWYLYSVDKTLSAIVLEVNNTFDERRPYLLVRDAADWSRNITLSQRLRIKGTRVKDFHVSPFNSREGYYSVLTSDPLGPEMNGFRGIDVTITLNSSKGQPKLIARLFSDGPAVDPASLGPLSKLTFLARWFWVGFATLPRIFWQAAVLLYRLKLDMWSKPEPLMGTLGRKATSVEQSLERCFNEYLEFLTRRSGNPISVKYYASAFLSCPERIFTSSTGQDPENDMILELRVLTPAFYSRFIQYWNDLDAVNKELNVHKTIWVDKPELLACIFGKMSTTARSMSLSDRVFASLLRFMRNKSGSITLDSTVEGPSRTCHVAFGNKEDTMSTMDAYILSNGRRDLKREFKCAAIRQLVADRLFMGRTEILDWTSRVARVGIAYGCVKFLIQIMRS